LIARFNSVNGITRCRLARLNVDGSTDLAFDPLPANFSAGIDMVSRSVLH